MGLPPGSCLPDPRMGAHPTEHPMSPVQCIRGGGRGFPSSGVVSGKCHLGGADPAAYLGRAFESQPRSSKATWVPDCQLPEARDLPSGFN